MKPCLDRYFVPRLLLALLVSSSALFAQSALSPKPPAVPTPSEVAARGPDTGSGPKDETIVLNPFVVSSALDRGYASTATLSGSRIDTPARYLAASITEINTAFMQDLGLFNMNEVMDFTPNAMSYDNGRSGSLTDANQNASITGSFRSSIRGAIIGSTSRDFLVTRVPDDGYNTDRVSVNRGPNAILFGLGSPQGIVNAVSSWPEMKDKYQLAARVDNWGSRRGTFKLNKQIVRGKAALLLAGLEEDWQTIFKPSNRINERLYGAITLKPLKDTTVRANFEHGRIRSAAARPFPLSDGLSTWINAGRNEVPPELEAGGARFATSLSLTPEQSAQIPALNARLAQLGFQIGYAGGIPRPTMILNSKAPLPWMTALGEATTRYNLGVGVANVQNFTLLNPPIPYTTNVMGWSTGFKQRWQSHMVIIDQAIGKNLFIQGIFNRVNDDFFVNNTAPVPNNTLHIDKSEFVATIDGRAIPNPNYNRYYVGYYNSGAQHFYRDDQNAVLQAAYTLNLKERFRGGWGNLLGNHKFLGLGQRTSADTVSVFPTPRNTTPDALRGVLPQANPLYFSSITYAAGSPLHFKSYIDPADRSTWALPNAADLFGPYKELWADSAFPARNPTGVTPGWVVVTSNRNYQIIDSRVAVMQNYFWDDRVALTLGFRRDKSTVYSMASSPRSNVTVNGVNDWQARIFEADRTSGSAIYPVTRYEQIGRTKTSGIVLHPLRWLGVFFNQSNNFNSIGSAANIDIFGRVLPPSNAVGRDWGVRMSLMKGKAYLNIARYTMIQKDVPNGFFRQAFGGSFVGENVRIIVSDELFNQTGKDEFKFRPWVSGNSPQQWNGTGGVWEKGYELSLTANPTPNWRISASLSKQYSASSNYGGIEREWYDWALDFVKKNYPQTLNVSTRNGAQNRPQTLAEDFDDLNTVLLQMQSLSGRADSRQPEFTGTLLTGYDFTQGRLKGMGVGGNYRYRGRQAIGYAFKQGSTVLFDANRPFYGPVRSPIGLFVYRTFKLTDRVRCRLQLNADNINFNRNLYPFEATDNGAGKPVVVKYAVGQGTTWALNATFDY